MHKSQAFAAHADTGAASVLLEPMRRLASACLYLMPLLLAFSRGGADVACVIIGILFLLHSTLSRQWSWLRQKEVTVLLLLWSYLAVVAPLTPYNAGESLTYALIWVRFLLFYAAVRYWLLCTPHSLRLFVLSAAPIILACVIDAFWQYVTGVSLSGRVPGSLGSRLTGPLAHANIGNLLLKLTLPVFGLCLYWVFSGHKKKILWPSWALAASVMALITISGERSSALLMLLAMAIIGGILFLRCPDMRRWITLSAALTVLLMGTLAVTQPVVAYRAHYMAQQLGDFGNSVYGQLFRSAFHLWREHPLIGIGPRQFYAACPDTMQALGTTYCDVHPHNLYVEWLEAGGILGLGLFLLAMALLLRKAISGMDVRNNAVILAAFACAQTIIIIFPFIITQSQFANWPSLLFWYSLALAGSLPKAGADA